MNTLISISTPSATIARSELEEHRVRTLPILVISPHNQCDCHCVMCDIWKIREAEEFSVADLERQITAFRELGVSWVVFTGGEPQKNRHLPALAKILRAEGIRITLLTAGLLLGSQAQEIADSVDDVIVSLDGPPELHNRIRRVAHAFEKLADGVTQLRHLRPDISIKARCTIQKLNRRFMCATVDSALSMGLNSISFLAADVSSTAFNRPSAWSFERQEQVALGPSEVEELEAEVARLVQDHPREFDSGFIAESPQKLHHIARHFRASLGQVEAISPRCNAPWTSAVIEAGGDVRPCFFHPPLGNTRVSPLHEILNSTRALQFRANLDIASDPICRHCVCSLYVPNPESMSRTVTSTMQSVHGEGD
jgi:Fe-coproporphyrin III synthase